MDITRNASKMPIYLQVAEKIKSEIFRGVYAPGTKLPPIRRLSKEIRVSSNTVQRAIYVIKHESFIEKRSPHGFFVISDSNCLTKLKLKATMRILNEFLHSMRQIGYTDKVIFELVTSFQS
jgi:DNA-binding transcriptional regulator YhcF (GntR family)